MDLSVLIPAVLGSSAVTALASGLWGYLSRRRRQTIDWDQHAKETVLKVLADERQENAEQGKTITLLSARIEQLIVENAELKNQIRVLELKLDQAMALLEGMKKGTR